MHDAGQLFEIRETRYRGKELFSKEFMPRGTITFFECQQCKRISKGGYELLAKDEKTFVQRYGYTKTDGSYLVPCDKIIYLNHSCNANTLDSGRGFDIVVRDIAKGEEATYDYRLFHDSDKLAFQCLCGDVCCKIVRCAHPPSKELANFWNRRINSAIERMNDVRQPLGEKLF